MGVHYLPKLQRPGCLLHKRLPYAYSALLIPGLTKNSVWSVFEASLVGPKNPCCPVGGLRHPWSYRSAEYVRPHVAKTVRDFCSAQHMQLLSWPAYLLDMSPIENVWNLVGWRLARDPRPGASKDELLLRIQAIWNFLPQADIQNLFDSMPRRTALIVAHGGYTKY
ncbi:hypothetical protein TNCV_3295691 [Trichonephila clavipes]|uniref:Uncharacterized protein n=1 Tax=Trichonephila clavipes TaxID=2585209 RepID=A0A8X6T1H1_TRICX|nr:hypothetical protein TNCV_3295691 [Trichonephila clavipes]